MLVYPVPCVLLGRPIQPCFPAAARLARIPLVYGLRSVRVPTALLAPVLQRSPALSVSRFPSLSVSRVVGVPENDELV